MPDELIRVIHDLERAIRVWELVRDSTQQLVDETTASYEQGRAVEANPAVAKARADIATYNRAILGARARIAELERDNQAGT
jgi:hypothetical protein